MVDYAIRRTKTHLHNFTRLFYAISEDRYDEPWLEQLESENNIFPEINYRVFSSDYRGTVR
jgi:1,4-alpha-glucan branching enzyme